MSKYCKCLNQIISESEIICFTLDPLTLVNQTKDVNKII